MRRNSSELSRTALAHLALLSALAVVGVGLPGSTSAGTNLSRCDNWSDADFTADANQSDELLRYITAPELLDADIEYNELSPEKPRVDRVYRFDSREKVRCRKLAVRNGKISVREAAENYTRALAKFRGCDEGELEDLIEHHRKRFSNQQRSQHLIGVKRPDLAPEKVHRLNWATEFFEKTEGRIFAFMSGPSTGEENFGTAVFRLKTRDGKSVDKRVPITTVGNEEFCETIPAIERRLNALYHHEQERLLAKKSGDGTSECLAWFSSMKEFNGKPAGTGLLAYLKVEPVTTDRFDFDPAYSTVMETDVIDSRLKKLTLIPFQSVDRVSLVRDPEQRLVTAELHTPGVRKSKFGDELFFDKTIDFEYSSGRCRPQTIEYGDSSRKFKITLDECKSLQKSGGEADRRTLKSARDFLVTYQKKNRRLASAKSEATPAKKSTAADPSELVRGFCAHFDYYLE